MTEPSPYERLGGASASAAVPHRCTGAVAHGAFAAHRYEVTERYPAAVSR